ncbi:hypothetical protein, partial [Mesorhizobium sp. M7A.F.Ca.CA.004.07.1.1]
SYGTFLPMVLICAGDPPLRRVFRLMHPAYAPAKAPKEPVTRIRYPGPMRRGAELFSGSGIQ